MAAGVIDGSLANFFLQGMAQGFRVGYRTLSTHLSTARQNMCSTLAHPEVVEEYLAKERRDGRVLGPFPLEISPPVHVSRFGVIPKSGKPNKWRLIIDLSHPQQRSVNDGIPKALCSMTYVRVDDAINQLVASGPGSLMAKIDIRNAFRLIHLLAMQWKGQVFVDSCLPFGLRSAPKLFNILADLLEWVAKDQGVTNLLHYLDDFFMLGPPDSFVCGHNLDILIHAGL